MRKPVVAIIGRQNVGKSTLFNALIGKQVAIVENLPGTTRDRIFAEVSWRDTSFVLVDTGGLEPEARSTLARGVNEQVEIAIAEADVLVFLVDVTSGITASDEEIADRLRQVGKPVILTANKADNDRLEAGAAEFYRLGMGEPLAISAYHRRGVIDILDKIVSLLPPSAPEEATPDIMKLAVVGRPNVGKSTLLNAILGEKRALVDETPGTTRDAIDTLVKFDGESILLIDTAGIRRRGQVGVGIERYSVIRALEAIDRADVAILLMDATEPLTAQDMHIAGYVQQAAKGIILIVNKWDLSPSRNMKECTRFIQSRLKFMPYAPVLFVSAKEGQGVDKVLPMARRIYQERLKRIPTAEVNRVVQEAAAVHNLPRRGGRELKVLYATQVEVNPPTFVFSVNDPKLVHFSYQRYLENRLRRAYGFTGTPIRLLFRARSEHVSR